MFYKFDFFKVSLFLFSFIFLLLVLFNFLSPNEAFAMEPPLNTDALRSFSHDSYLRYELNGNPASKLEKLKYWDQINSRWYIDYYDGTRRYKGEDPYGFFHPPQNVDKATQVEPLSSTKTVYDNSYKASSNPTNQVSHNSGNYNYHDPKAKNINSLSGNQSRIYELDGKELSKHVCKPEHKELNLWVPGQSLRGANPVIYELPSPRVDVIFELDADYYEDTISTTMNSTRFNDAVEFVRNYKLDNISAKHGVLSNINLGIKTTRTNIIFIYIKFQQIGKRKIMWNIWEKHKDRYESYKDFKRSWDSNTGVFSKIKEDVRENIRSEVEDLLGVKKINRNLKRSVRKEVERLLRDTHPFGK